MGSTTSIAPADSVCLTEDGDDAPQLTAVLVDPLGLRKSPAGVPVRLDRDPNDGLELSGRLPGRGAER